MHSPRLRAAALALVVVAPLCGLASRVAAQDPSLDPAATRLAAQTLVDGLNAADGTKVQSACTPELWGRLAPSFASGPAPGSFGTFEVIQATPLSLNRVGYTIAYLSCRHADGVEDVVLVTLKVVGSTWKVCGGPTCRTPANPLG